MMIKSFPSLGSVLKLLSDRFGDITTQDKKVFPFFPDRPCNGIAEALNRYSEITPSIQLSGPTSFAPLIRGFFIEINC
jgi:hypothetical protein